MPERSERFVSKGLRTGVPGDALKEGEYSMLVNVRGNTREELTTRAGHVLKFSTFNQPIQAISSYNQSQTDEPRYLAAVGNDVFLDNGVNVAGGFLAEIPSMVPFRPAQSPDSWMYVAGSQQYRKLSAPTAANVVTNSAVGIIEPQSPPAPAVNDAGFNVVAPDFPTWTHSGTAGSVTTATSGRASSTVIARFLDPAGGFPTFQVDPTIVFQREQLLYFASIPLFARINDVFTPIPSGIVIEGIQYLSGTTGQCVIVPAIQSPGNINPFRNDPEAESSIFSDAIIANLRKGSLVQIGSEVCYVWDVELGPSGSVCFTTSTVSNHTTSDTLSGVAAIQLNAVTVPGGTAFISGEWDFSISGSGIGSVQFTNWGGAALQPNFFTQFGASFQPDDYVHFSVKVSDLTQLTEMKLLFDVNNGSVDYASNVYFYAVRPSDIQAGIANTLTQLGVAQLYTQRQLIQEESSIGVASSTQTAPGSGQWSEIIIPLKNFIRIGTAQAQTLNSSQGVQFLFNTVGACNVSLSSITIHGQGQLDVGLSGPPIIYRLRPRSTATGVRGNPSPACRFGVSPRRQNVNITLPSAVDPQQDVWDVFRIGSTLDSYRLVGTASTGSIFIDQFSDESLANAEVLTFDDLQPWPTLDLPLFVPSGVTVNGTIVTFTIAGSSPHATLIPRYLPGNLVQIKQNVFTLFSRPTVVGSTTLTVTFRLVENAGVDTNSYLNIYEPLIAAQVLPFVWGPTAEGGTMFGCGDTFRPGNVYFTKNFNPDSAPDRYNLELAPPSEPLTGGVLRAGECYVSSNVHWWALRPSFGGVNQWTPRLLPLPEGLGAVSHFAICEQAFVAKDGIYDFTGKSITTRDNIYSLFPHEGVAGIPQVVAGVTINPPDYTKVNQFRLCHANGFLYFDFPETVTGNIAHLIYDTVAGAWYCDQFSSGNLTTHYSVPQEDETATTLVLAGDVNGNVMVETYGVSDNGRSIACTVVTREFCPGGWSWSWFENPHVDLLPTAQSALNVQGISLGTLLGSPTPFQATARVTQGIVSMGGGVPLKSLGLVFTWLQEYIGLETQPVVLYILGWNEVPYPDPVLAQKTKATSFGLKGFQHLYLGQLAFIPTPNPITLTITPDQGSQFTVTIPPQPLTGIPMKFEFKFPANKFKMASYEVSASAQFFLWPDDTELWIKEWGSSGPYQVIRPWSGPSGEIA